MVLTRRAMSSLTEVQLATVGLMQAGSVALTFRCNLSFEDNVTSGRMVRRGGEALVKKGRKKKKISMKTNEKKNPCKTKCSRIGFPELV